MTTLTRLIQLHILDDPAAYPLLCREWERRGMLWCGGGGDGLNRWVPAYAQLLGDLTREGLVVIFEALPNGSFLVSLAQHREPIAVVKRAACGAWCVYTAERHGWLKQWVACGILAATSYDCAPYARCTRNDFFAGVMGAAPPNPCESSLK
jgi:hypothetical protein